MKTKTVICECCNKEFTYEVQDMWRPDRKYCSSECKNPRNTVKCIECGKEFHRKPSHEKRSNNIFCGSVCHYKWETGRKSDQVGNGENSHKWKGGRKITSGGYIEIYAPEHPRALKQSGQSAYVKEHILVAEKALGRYLHRGETPHHIDEDTQNNEVLNLYLFNTPGKHTAYHHALKRGDVGILESNLI